MTNHSFIQYDPDQGGAYRLMPRSAHTRKTEHPSAIQLRQLLIKTALRDRKHDDFASRPDNVVVRLIPKARYFTP